MNNEDRDTLPYAIRAEWKEVVVYSEGDETLVFSAGWGVTPPTLMVEGPLGWARSKPSWAASRRDTILARLVAESGHVLDVYTL